MTMTPARDESRPPVEMIYVPRCNNNSNSIEDHEYIHCKLHNDEFDLEANYQQHDDSDATFSSPLLGNHRSFLDVHLPLPAPPPASPPLDDGSCRSHPSSDQRRRINLSWSSDELAALLRYHWKKSVQMVGRRNSYDNHPKTLTNTNTPLPSVKTTCSAQSSVMDNSFLPHPFHRNLNQQQEPALQQPRQQQHCEEEQSIDEDYNFFDRLWAITFKLFIIYTIRYLKETFLWTSDTFSPDSLFMKGIQSFIIFFILFGWVLSCHRPSVLSFSVFLGSVSSGKGHET